MSSKTSRGAVPTKNAAKDTAPQNLLADLGRQQLAAATDAACAMFRGSEAMRAVQQQAAHEASLRHQAAAKKLHESCAADELLAIQSDLLRFDLQGATRYWQQITTVALQSQIEMMASASHLLAGEQSKGWKSAMENFQAALAFGNGLFLESPKVPSGQTTT